MVQSRRYTWEWTFMCCSRLTAWPKVFLQMLQPNGLVPLCDLLTWTSSPWGVEKTWNRVSPSINPADKVNSELFPEFPMRHGDVRLTWGAYLVTGDAVVGVRCGGVVCAAVQRLLWLRAAVDVGAVQRAGVLQHRGAEAHLTELIGGGHRLPGICWLVVGRKFCHVRLWWGTKKKKDTDTILGYFSDVKSAEEDGRHRYKQLTSQVVWLRGSYRRSGWLRMDRYGTRKLYLLLFTWTTILIGKLLLWLRLVWRVWAQNCCWDFCKSTTTNRNVIDRLKAEDVTLTATINRTCSFKIRLDVEC